MFQSPSFNSALHRMQSRNELRADFSCVGASGLYIGFLPLRSTMSTCARHEDLCTGRIPDPVSRPVLFWTSSSIWTRISTSPTGGIGVTSCANEGSGLERSACCRGVPRGGPVRRRCPQLFQRARPGAPGSPVVLAEVTTRNGRPEVEAVFA